MKKKNKTKIRNWMAFNAIFVCNAHQFRDKKKDESRKACRKPIKEW